jgi:hypothetical protein
VELAGYARFLKVIEGVDVEGCPLEDGRQDRNRPKRFWTAPHRVGPRLMLAASHGPKAVDQALVELDYCVCTSRADFLIKDIRSPKTIEIEKEGVIITLSPASDAAKPARFDLDVACPFDVPDDIEGWQPRIDVRHRQENGAFYHASVNLRRVSSRHWKSNMYVADALFLTAPAQIDWRTARLELRDVPVVPVPEKPQ